MPRTLGMVREKLCGRDRLGHGLKAKQLKRCSYREEWFAIRGYRKLVLRCQSNGILQVLQNY